MDTVEVKQVVITTLKRRGVGVSEDPVRIIPQVWDMNGSLLFEVDDFQEVLAREREVQLKKYAEDTKAALREVDKAKDVIQELVNDIGKLKKENESLQKEIARLQPNEINPLEHENMK